MAAGRGDHPVFDQGHSRRKEDGDGPHEAGDQALWGGQGKEEAPHRARDDERLDGGDRQALGALGRGHGAHQAGPALARRTTPASLSGNSPRMTASRRRILELIAALTFGLKGNGRQARWFPRSLDRPFGLETVRIGGRGVRRRGPLSSAPLDARVGIEAAAWANDRHRGRRNTELPMGKRWMGDSWRIREFCGTYRFMHRWHLAPEEEPRLVTKFMARIALQAAYRSTSNDIIFRAMHRAMRFDLPPRYTVSPYASPREYMITDLLFALERGALVAIQEEESAPPRYAKEEHVPEPEPPAEVEPRRFEVRVVWDDTGEPVIDLPLVVDPGRGALSLETDANGRVRVENVTSLSCECRSSFRGIRYDECALFAGSGDAARPPANADRAALASRRPKSIVQVETLKVRTGDSLQSIGQSHGVAWRDLAYFNWGTRELEAINSHPAAEVGCTKKSPDGKTYLFDDADSPGTLLVPRQWRQPGLATGLSHVLRVRPPELRFGRCVNASYEAIAARSYRIFKNGKKVHDGVTDASGWILAPFKYEKQYEVRFHHADYA